MKKKIIFLAILILGVSASSAQAKDLSKLKINISQNINADCGITTGAEVSGCYRQTPRSGEDTLFQIYISKDISSKNLINTFLELMGYFYTYDLSEEQLASTFNIPPKPMTSAEIRKTAAAKFAAWFRHENVVPLQDLFFRDLLKNK